MEPQEITVLLPVYKPQEDYMNNLRFIVNRFLDCKVRVMVVEQSKNEYSYLAKFVENIAVNHKRGRFLSFNYYLSDSEIFKKEPLINWAVKEKIRTKYVWINDPNFYLRYQKILDDLYKQEDPSFVSVYSMYKRLDQEQTEKIISNQGLTVNDYEIPQEGFGAYSLFVDRKELMALGGLSEDDFVNDNFISRLNAYNKAMTVLENLGAHLYNQPRITPVERMVFTDNVFEKDMAVIICHFNWCKYMNPTRNLHRFLRQMDIDDLPVYGVELSLTGKFETAGRKNWAHVTVNERNICFQKEACINAVEKFVPPEYKKIAWIDPDLHFTNKNWYRETSAKLEEYKLVQMYSEGYGTDRYGRTNRIHPSVMAMYKLVPMDYWFQHPGHPGGAWGARRELWQNGGLYPYCIVGGGDTAFVYTLFGYSFPKEVYQNLGFSGKHLFQPYVDWKEKITAYIKPEDVTYINNTFIHEWHGDREKRGYNLRHEILKKINIFKNVQLNDIGLVELVNIERASTYSVVLNYFKLRDEDGVVGDMEDFLDFKNKRNEQAI